MSEYKALYRDAVRYRYTDTLLQVFKVETEELKNRMIIVVAEKEEQKKHYDGQIFNVNSQLAEKDFQIEELKIENKKERRKRRLVTGLGIAATAATIVVPLFIKK